MRFNLADRLEKKSKSILRAADHHPMVRHALRIILNDLDHEIAKHDLITFDGFVTENFEAKPWAESYDKASLLDISYEPLDKVSGNGFNRSEQVRRVKCYIEFLD